MSKVHWPPAPTWENAYRLASKAVRWWDMWCADDGRPGMALAALNAYRERPDEKHLNELRKHRTGVYASISMAYEVMPRIVRGKPPPIEAATAAFFAARAVWFLADAFLVPVRYKENRFAHAIESAGLANLYGALHYEVLDDVPDTDEVIEGATA